ncbi:hypothetical protein [Variovorax sp. YR634]|uniref:hypothetical protein n=1 Tax=Variovorax sp. YR634 TaxID=1884385 RepID=UPI001C40BAEB|nr:hypothetical protein [Variovorax sp. YR634]
MTGVLIAAALALATCVVPAVPAHAADDRNAQPAALMIKEQGSFAVGGTVIRSPGAEGQTLHGDHARVFYQVPLDARKLPLVMWHGFGQFGKTWETTADGREGSSCDAASRSTWSTSLGAAVRREAR